MTAGNDRRSISIPKAFLFTAFAIALSPQLNADVSYDYTGNLLTPSPFNTNPVCSNPECNIEGEFTLANALNANLNMATIAPPSFSFQFGLGTVAHVELDQSNTSCSMGCAQIFEISTDATGAISQWQIILADKLNGDHFLISSSGDSVSELSGELSWSNTTPGTWTSTVPEPSALILLATMCCAGLLARRRRSRFTTPQTPKK
jgi:hypothetical protein